MATLAKLRGTSSNPPPVALSSGAPDARLLAFGSERIPAPDLRGELLASAEPTPGPPVAAAPDPELEGDLAPVTADDLRPVAVIVALVFVVFTIYNWLAFPAGVRAAICAYDLALVALGAALAAVCPRIRSTRGLYAAAAVLSLAVLGNILLAAALATNPLFSFYVAVLVIASAGSVPSPSWGAAIATVEVAAWAVVADRVLPGAELVAHAFVVVSSIAVAVIVHIGRRRARARILELRSGAARREHALQHALAEADEARETLDRKVGDRTAALRAELAERERLEAQLRHAQKMEAVGRLAGGIAHDFNNLLTVIRLSHITIGEPGARPDEVREALQDASDATDRAAALTHELLAFARKQTLERTTVPVADILGGVERMVRRVAEATIRVEVRVAPDVGEVVADHHQIDQVLLNLAINACDAMAGGGTLSVAAHAVELDGAAAAHHRLRPGSYVCIAVSDTGTGMDEATRRSVFEPFFTTKEVGRGTGLGLAVAHGIVTQHGGQIDVATELGKGSTFTVYLPRARGGSMRQIARPAKPLGSPGHETVLVVEDEDAVRRSVQRNLERLGYRVVVARDGEHALGIAESLTRVDLLLSDVVMPGIDGPALAGRLRARWADLPVVFVTGYSADRLARSSAISRHDCVLEKPYQPEELARTIRQILETRGGHRGASAGLA